MACYLWRSDAPSRAVPYPTIAAGYRAMVTGMAACRDRRVEWCLVHAPRAGGTWDTVVCGRHGDLV